LRTRAVLAAAALAAVALTLAGCGGGDTPKNADALVFVSTRDGPYEIYASKADGSDQHRLTKDKGDASNAAGLYYQIDPAWSPNAKRIVFASSRDGGLHLWVVDAAGEKSTRLTNGKMQDKHPTWSPDGRQIAFARGAPSRVDVMNADGSGAQSLTSGDDEQTDPAWSPNGRWIAFSRRTPASPTREIWLAHPDGTGAHPVTKLQSSSVGPSWSPDGKRIAFASNARGGLYAIYTISIEGNDLKEVDSSQSDEVEPAWSPNGRLIAFTRDGAIVTVAAGGGAEATLTDPSNNDSSAAWKPTVRAGGM
jgi:Tol biopolymer transport system component